MSDVSLQSELFSVRFFTLITIEEGLCLRFGNDIMSMSHMTMQAEFLSESFGTPVTIMLSCFFLVDVGMG